MKRIVVCLAQLMVFVLPAPLSAASPGAAPLSRRDSPFLVLARAEAATSGLVFRCAAGNASQFPTS